MTLIRALKENRDSKAYPFHMPGHKRMLASDDLLRQIYGIDITETEGFDDLHNAHGIIRDAENRAAALFGADETHFLVNGSTGGILAAVTGCVMEGDSVIYASNCHRSVVNAVMLSGAGPYVITPEPEILFGISGGVRADAVSKALDEVSGKRVAVVITSPTYEGITSDVASIAKACHDKDALLIVDAAHGAHLGLSDKFPQSAVEAGADVVVTSVHKTLPAMTQTALIHINKNCPSKERIRKMLSVFQTSSPSYVLMASADSMTELLEEHKEELFSAYNVRLDEFYERAEELKCLSVLCKEKLSAKGSAGHDRSKIVVKDMTSTYTGRQLSDILRERYGLVAEMAAGEYVLLMTGVADSDEGFDRLSNALCRIDEELENHLQKDASCELISGVDSRTCSYENRIKEVLFDDNIEYIPVELSGGRIAADFVYIYPPGIPVTIPGVAITDAAADSLLGAIKNGLEISGLKNKEIAVLWERSST